MYGLNGRITAHPGRGAELTANLLEAAELLRGDGDCLLYVVSRALDDPDSIVVNEAWRTREAHAASLEREGVREIIGRSMPMIAGTSDRVELEPLGGKGLSA